MGGNWDLRHLNLGRLAVLLGAGLVASGSLTAAATPSSTATVTHTPGIETPTSTRTTSRTATNTMTPTPSKTTTSTTTKTATVTAGPAADTATATASRTPSRSATSTMTITPGGSGGSFTATQTPAGTVTASPTTTAMFCGDPPLGPNQRLWVYATGIGSGVWTGSTGTPISPAEAAKALNQSPNTAQMVLLEEGEQFAWEIQGVSGDPATLLNVQADVLVYYEGDGLDNTIAVNFSVDGTNDPAMGSDSTWTGLGEGSTGLRQNYLSTDLFFTPLTWAKFSNLKIYLKNTSSQGTAVQRRVWLRHVGASAWFTGGSCVGTATNTSSVTPTFSATRTATGPAGSFTTSPTITATKTPTYSATATPSAAGTFTASPTTTAMFCGNPSPVGGFQRLWIYTTGLGTGAWTGSVGTPISAAEAAKALNTSPDPAQMVLLEAGEQYVWDIQDVQGGSATIYSVGTEISVYYEGDNQANTIEVNYSVDGTTNPALGSNDVWASSNEGTPGLRQATIATGVTFTPSTWANFNNLKVYLRNTSSQGTATQQRVWIRHVSASIYIRGGACVATDTSTPTPTQTPSLTPTEIPTSAFGSYTATITSTVTPTFSATRTPTGPAGSHTASPTFSSTKTPATSTPTRTSTSVVGTFTSTSTALIGTATVTLTVTPTFSATATRTAALGTATSSASPTSSATMTPTVTLSLTATGLTTVVPPTLVPLPILPPGRTRIFPSPARGPQTSVGFLMPKSGQARIVVLDVRGQVVLSVTEDLSAGNSAVSLDIRNLRRGIYVYRVILQFTDGSQQRLQGGRFAVLR